MSHGLRASRPALVRPERRTSESDGLGAVSAARAARRAALKPYSWSHTRAGIGDRVPGWLTCPASPG